MQTRKPEMETTRTTLMASELVPGQVVVFDDKLQQVQHIDVKGCRYIDREEPGVVRQVDLRISVELCSEDGEVSTADLACSFEVPIAYVPVFELGIPKGFVSRANYKKCYEDEVAKPAEPDRKTKAVTRGSQWESSNEVTLMGVTVKIGEVCTVYDLPPSMLQSCRLMNEHGGDLGVLTLKFLRDNFKHVGFTENIADVAVAVTEPAPAEPVLVNSEWELIDDKEANRRAVGKRRWVTHILPNCGYPLYAMVDRHGTDLGTAQGDVFHRLYRFVKNDSKPTATTKVKLTYFKPSGKYYIDGEYFTELDTFWEIIEEVYTKLIVGNCPGLKEHGVARNDFTTSIEILDELLGVPHVITPLALATEYARRGRPYPGGPTMPMYELYLRHHQAVAASGVVARLGDNVEVASG